jgi:hypothetical protein
MNMRSVLIGLALFATQTPTAFAQRQTFGVVPAVQYYRFADELDVQSARLFIVPVGYELSLSSRLTIDAYGAFARGDVEVGNETHTLQGIVDTRVRASIAATPWAVLTLGVNIPTGKASHDESEAIVASALSTELLGFREALWGTGLGFTTGIATASRIGETGIGFGASYRLASEFEPIADSAFTYTPGNEARVRLALDRNIGTSKLTFGVTFQNYTADEAQGRQLFAPGNRFRVDGTYSFRTSNTSTWTLFATDVWRENGDVTLPLQAGTVLTDTTFQAGQQNLAVFGLAGSVQLGSRTSLQPAADFRLLTRDSGAGEGWLVAAGTDLPIRRSGFEVVPNFRVSYGQLEDANDEKHPFWGGEVGLALRFGSR